VNIKIFIRNILLVCYQAHFIELLVDLNCTSGASLEGPNKTKQNFSQDSYCLGPETWTFQKLVVTITTALQTLVMVFTFKN
jgi:hypothetical protein